MARFFRHRFKPYLKSAVDYASVSANCKSRGKQIVRDTLATLNSSLVFIKPQNNDQVELLRRVHLTFEAANLPEKLEADCPIFDWDPKLLRFPNPIRQFVFLRYALALSDREVSLVTGIDEYSVRAFLKAADDIHAVMSGSRILIIEDDIWIANHLQDILQSDGHTIVGIAKTAERAVELARDTKPNLIISDVRLEDGSSGIISTIEIQRQNRIPTIFVTAFPEMVERLRPISCAAIIAKPFNDNEVRSSVASALSDVRSG